MLSSSYVPGDIFKSAGPSYALTTDPWGKTERTISYADHTKIVKDQTVMLLEYADIKDSVICVWLFNESVVWQILSKKIFKKCWIKIKTEP